MGKKGNIVDVYALSPMQEGILFHVLLEPDSRAYFEQLKCRVAGKLDHSALEKSLGMLFEQYEVLRTAFVVEGFDRSLQVVLRDRKPVFQYRDFSGLADEKQARAVDDFIAADLAQGFDLREDPLMRLSLLRTAEDEHVMVWSHHHLILDGWCSGILIQTFFSYYHALLEGKVPRISSVPPYRNYINWLSTRSTDASKAYWKQYLAGLEGTVSFPKRSVPGSAPYLNARHAFEFEAALSHSLIGLAAELRVTLNTLMQCLWAIMLSKYNRSDDIVFGVVTSGRPAEIPQVDKMVGLFLNTIPVRIQLDRSQKFQDLVREVQEAAIASDAHQFIPITEIQAQSAQERNLINHLFIFENFPTVSGAADDKPVQEKANRLQISDVNAHTQTNYDFNCVFVPGERFSVRIQYDLNVYDPAVIARIGGHFHQLARQVLVRPEVEIHRMDMLTEDEKREIISGFNDTHAAFPDSATLHELFEAQVVQHPDRVAVRRGDESMSFAELNSASNQLAHYLRGQGQVAPGQRIGIWADRSPASIISILASLKVGAAYVPISPSYPQARIDFMIQDAEIKLLLHGDMPNTAVPTDACSCMAINPGELAEHPSENLAGLAKPEGIAYVIYTSGSTGQPKGVLLRHSGVVNRIHWMWKEYDFRQEDVIFQKTPLIFDVSVWEVFLPLCFGMEMVLCAAEDIHDPRRIASLIQQHGITTLHFVPTMYNAFLRGLPNADRPMLNSLKRIINSGEALTMDTVQRHYDLLEVPLHNLYGPTEASVDVSFHACQAHEKTIPIGKPIDNTQLLILDADDHLAPVGGVGELLIGGVGLATGYLNRPELTREKFIPNPLGGSGRLYRTGDLARWLPNGEIEFLGRMDGQVKVNGHRIELGEIRMALLAHPQVSEVAVRAVAQADQHKQLLAWYVAPQEIPFEELRAFLGHSLPAYMIPTGFWCLAAMPLTPSGKMDLQALPIATVQKAKKRYSPPGSPLEKLLVEIWEAVLDRSPIGIQENFFALGGDSIKAIQIASRMFKAGFKMEVRDLLKYPVIAELAHQVFPADRQASQEIVVGDFSPIPVQHRFFVSGQPELHHYTQALSFELADRIEPAELEMILSVILKHHDALRIVVLREGDNILLRNQAEVSVSVPLYDLREATDAEAKMMQHANELHRSMDLEHGPLVKVCLFRLREGDRFLISIHHLVVDGLSWRVLMEDFALLYSNLKSGKTEPLPAKTDAFQLWSENLSRFANSKAILEELPYWANLLERKVADVPQTGAPTKALGGQLDFVLDSAATKLLQSSVHQAFNTEINDILLAGLGLGLQATFGTNRFLIALEGHGREGIIPGLDISRTVGWFTTIYPVMLAVNGAEVGTMVQETKEMLRRIPNRGIGFGILRYLTEAEHTAGIEWDRKPLLLFNHLGQFERESGSSGLKIANSGIGVTQSPKRYAEHLIEIDSLVSGGILRVNVQYDHGAFSSDTMAHFAHAFKGVLEKIIQFCAARDATVATSSDFDYQGLSSEELDTIFD